MHTVEAATCYIYLHLRNTWPFYHILLMPNGITWYRSRSVRKCTEKIWTQRLALSRIRVRAPGGFLGFLIAELYVDFHMLSHIFSLIQLIWDVVISWSDSEATVYQFWPESLVRAYITVQVGSMTCVGRKTYKIGNFRCLGLETALFFLRRACLLWAWYL